jgi:hypothetical protein
MLGHLGRQRLGQRGAKESMCCPSCPVWCLSAATATN